VALRKGYKEEAPAERAVRNALERPACGPSVTGFFTRSFGLCTRPFLGHPSDWAFLTPLPVAGHSFFLSSVLPPVPLVYRPLVLLFFLLVSNIYYCFSLCYCWFPWNSHMPLSLFATSFAGYLFGLLINSEDGSSTFHRNVGEIQLDNTTHLPENIGEDV
jgi:hypothetical protein